MPAPQQSLLEPSNEKRVAAALAKAKKEGGCATIAAQRANLAIETSGFVLVQTWQLS